MHSYLTGGRIRQPGGIPMTKSAMPGIGSYPHPELGLSSSRVVKFDVITDLGWVGGMVVTVG